MTGFAQAFAIVAAALLPPPLAETTVGLPGRVAVTIPGPAVEAVPPAGRRDPLVVRVARADGGRYELEFAGLEPRWYDLATALRRMDGSKMPISTVPVRVTPTRPAGAFPPRPPEVGETLPATGYGRRVVVLAALWCVGLVLILGWMLLARRREPLEATTDAAPVDPLRPLVAGAVAGTLSPAQAADLERRLRADWRRRLGVDRHSPPAAAAALRQAPGSAELLTALDDWLHRLPTDRDPDLAAALAEYRDPKGDRP